MKNLLKFRLKRSRRQEEPAPVHIPPSPLAQSLIQGYLKGLRDQLEAEGRDHEIPLASGTRDQLEADCSRKRGSMRTYLSVLLAMVLGLMLWTQP